MSDLLKQICVDIVLAGMAVFFSSVLHSEFLTKFLDQNLIVLLLALTAINGSTVGIIVGKMSDIMSRNQGIKFDKTRAALKAANSEQLVVVIIAVFIQILRNSTAFSALIPRQALVLEIVLTACLVHSIQIVFDILNSVFILVDHDAGQDE